MDWRAFLKEIWSRDTPIRPWGRERIEKIPPPEVEIVEKSEKTEKPAKQKSNVRRDFIWGDSSHTI